MICTSRILRQQKHYIWANIFQILLLNNGQYGGWRSKSSVPKVSPWRLAVAENTRKWSRTRIPVVQAKVSLYITPRGLDGVRVSPSKLINTANATKTNKATRWSVAIAVIDGAVRVTLRVLMSVRYSAVSDDRSAGSNSCNYNALQSASGSVRNGIEKRFTGHQVITQPQVLHVTLLRSKHTSFRNWIPRSLSL